MEISEKTDATEKSKDTPSKSSTDDSIAKNKRGRKASKKNE
jgi:hypothetical protein